MNHMCCIGITLAARIIAAAGLATSILMTNIVVSEYFAHEDESEFFGAIEVWSLLGLNWTQFIKTAQIPKQAQIILACFLGYSLLFLATCALLAYGTANRKPNYALPWLYLQMISIVDQTVALTIHLARPLQHEQVKKVHWYTPVSTVVLVIMIYCWTVVLSAREDWLVHPGHYDDFLYYDSSEETPRDSNMPKTPSFLAQSLSNGLPEPRIPPKYGVV